MKLFYLLLLLLFRYSQCANEARLRENLFRNYNKNNRPVFNNSDNILLKYGLEIKNLVYFNQKSENIELTMRNILSWKDNFLQWENEPKHIMINKNKIWIPDLELYNSASKPKLYDTSPLVKLYNDGTIEYNRYISYSFSCKLDLKEFPFDTQKCSMLFGSWKYSKKILDIKPFNDTDYFSNFSVSPDFSHNEWSINKISVDHNDFEYKCCPGELWPNSEYIIELKRNPHKYNLLIIMAVFITISSLFINYLDISLYYRTYILVFIPLTLIWLQIHISSKIPVISYSTKLESIISCCFLTTMFALFESGILYCFIYNYFRFIEKYIEINRKNIRNIGTHITKDITIVTKPTNKKNLDYPSISNIVYKIDIYYSIVLTLIFYITIFTLIF